VRHPLGPGSAWCWLQSSRLERFDRVVRAERPLRAAGDRPATSATPFGKTFLGTPIPVGQAIRAGNLPFPAVGVLTAKGTSGMGGDQDIAKEDHGPGLAAQHHGLCQGAAGELRRTRPGHADPPRPPPHRQGDPDDFSIRNLAGIAELADQSAQVMTMLLASIAGVSLVVGGIGIMNIMLVSVTERTRDRRPRSH